MMSISNVSAGAAASGYYKTEGYYMAGSPEGDAAARWFGEAAKEEGLQGRVDDAKFAQLLDGQAPNGQVLGRMVKGERQHRPGIDLTFSASKTVSIMALVAGDERVMQAHDKAVVSAMSYVEKNLVQTRRHVNGELKVVGGKMIAGMFRHDTSRALDPQLHTHVVIANMVKGDDGRYTALHNDQIYKHKMVGGEVYRNELAKELKSIGYEVERVGRHRFVEIKGVKPTLVETYAKRRAEIVEAIEARDVGATAKNNALAALATRAKKHGGIERSELIGAWIKEANAIGVTKDQLTELALAAKIRSQHHVAGVTRDGKGVNLAQSEARENVAFAIKHISERNSVYETKDVILAALKRSDKAGIKEITGEIVRLVKTGALIHGVSDGKPVLTDNETLLIERQTIREFRKTVREDGVKLAPTRKPNGQIIHSGEKHLTRSLSMTTLTTGQQEAVETSLSGKGRYVAVQGYAGTGKTFMLDKLRGYAERSGYTVEGSAPTNKAVENLAEAIPSSKTLQYRLLKNQHNPKIEDKSNTILVVDEASMITTKDMKALMDYTNASRYARVILVGDQKQLDAVGAGTPFATLQKAGMRTAVMTDIQRQRNKSTLEAVNHSIKGEIRAAFSKIDKNIVENPYDMTKAVANSWLTRSDALREKTSIVVLTNGMRQSVNQLIRDELQIEGKIGANDHTINALEPRHFSRAEAGDAKSYSKNDKIVPISPIKKYGLNAGEVYTVVRTDFERNQIDVMINGGGAVTTLPLGQASKVAGSVSIFKAVQRDLAIGDKIKLTITDKTQDIRNGDRAVVTAIDHKSVTLDLGNDKETTLPLDSLAAKGIDHGYVATAHDLQGSTVDNIIVAMRSTEMLATQKGFYVGISRAKDEVILVTDKVNDLAARLQSKTGERVSALDAYMDTHFKDREQLEKPEQRLGDKTRTMDPDKSMQLLVESFREAEKVKEELIERNQKQIEGPIR